jgi:hypothetical protein
MAASDKIKITPFKSAGEGRTFNYIDAMPGAGKTEYFVDKAARHLMKGGTNALLLYVAPTVQLLMEAQRRIFNKIPDRVKTRAVIVVSSRTEEMNEAKNQDLNIAVEKPANAANRLLQLISEEEYSSTPQTHGQRMNFAGRSVNDIKVLMITHEAFVRIRNLPREEMARSRMPLTRVVFDEARQCITKGQVLGQRAWGADPVVSGHEIESLQKVLTFSRASEISTDLNGRNTAFYNVVGMCTNKKTVAAVFKVDRYAQISKPMRAFLAELKETCAEGRNLMTVLLKVKNGKPDLQDSGFTPFTVLRPTELFSGYAEVTLMSALFRDSQMWHILTNYNGNKHVMNDLLDESYTKRDKSLRLIKQRHVKNKAMLPQRLVCIPLTTSSRGALSTNHLNTSCVLPKELDARISELAANSPGRAHRADMINFVLGGGVLFDDKELTRELKTYLAPPLWVMIRESYAALKKAGCKQALLFINSKSQHRVWEPGRIDYIHLIRDALRYTTEDVDEHDKQHLTTAEVRQKEVIDPRWFDFIRKAVHGKNKFFVTPRTTSVRGLNEYKDHVGYVHLAALNQENIMYSFFGHIMPEYDVDLDNVIDNVLQTLYRTNLREPDSDSKIYMVVSNEFAITKLAQKVFRREDQTFNTLPGYIPRLTALSYRGRSGPKNKETHLAVSVRGGLNKRKYPEAVGKEINNVRGYLRKALIAKVPNEKRIEMLNKRLEELQSQGKQDENKENHKRGRKNSLVVYSAGSKPLASKKREKRGLKLGT